MAVSQRAQVFQLLLIIMTVMNGQVAARCRTYAAADRQVTWTCGLVIPRLFRPSDVLANHSTNIVLIR